MSQPSCDVIIIRTYEYYDSPLFFVGLDKDDSLYLFLSLGDSDNNIGYERFLVKKTSPNILTELENGKMAVKNVFLETTSSDTLYVLDRVDTEFKRISAFFLYTLGAEEKKLINDRIVDDWFLNIKS